MDYFFQRYLTILANPGLLMAYQKKSYKARTVATATAALEPIPRSGGIELIILCQNLLILH